MDKEVMPITFLKYLIQNEDNSKILREKINTLKNKYKNDYCYLVDTKIPLSTNLDSIFIESLGTFIFCNKEDMDIDSRFSHFVKVVDKLKSLEKTIELFNGSQNNFRITLEGGYGKPTEAIITNVFSKKIKARVTIVQENINKSEYFFKIVLNEGFIGETFYYEIIDSEEEVIRRMEDYILDFFLRV